MGPSCLPDPEMLAVKLTSKKFCSSLLENHGGEEVRTTALTAQESCSLSPIEALTQRVSSWTKLVRVVAYALRFIQKTKTIKPVTLANGKMLTFGRFRLLAFFACKRPRNVSWKIANY